jgi:hypothetical protein
MTGTEIDRYLSTDELAMFGLQHIAYVKRVVVEGKVGYAVHAADGTPVAVFDDPDIAFAAVRQNDMEPVSVH